MSRVKEIDGKIRKVIFKHNVWYVWKDICDVIGAINQSQCLRDINFPESETYQFLDTIDENGEKKIARNATIISKKALYIITVKRSRNPKYKYLIEWINSFLTKEDTVRHDTIMFEQNSVGSQLGLLCRDGLNLLYQYGLLYRQDSQTIRANDAMARAGLVKEVKYSTERGKCQYRSYITMKGIEFIKCKINKTHIPLHPNTKEAKTWQTKTL